ncbi:SET domain-containing protein-lysine N-methyltransferase [Candidatus Margulisiibacteriota bacterium]
MKNKKIISSIRDAIEQNVSPSITIPVLNGSSCLENIPVHSFGKNNGSHYSDELLIPDITIREQVEKDARLHENDPGNLILLDKYRTMLENPNKTLNKFYIADTGVFGQGLFANDSFKPGGFIGEYAGAVVPKYSGEEVNLYKFLYEPYPGFTQADKKLELDGKYNGNHTRFINHNDEPNTAGAYIAYQGRWHIIFFATKEIKKGEQITFNYGHDYWQKMRILKIGMKKIEISKKIAEHNALLTRINNSPLPDDLKEQLIGIHTYVNQTAARGYDDRISEDEYKPGDFFTLRSNYDQLRGHFGRLLIYCRELFAAYNGYYEPESGLRALLDDDVVPLEYAFGIAGNGLSDIGTSYHNDYVIDNENSKRVIYLHNHEKTCHPDDVKNTPTRFEQVNDFNNIRKSGLPKNYIQYIQVNEQHFLEKLYYSPILDIFDYKTLAWLSRDQYMTFLEHYLQYNRFEFKENNNLYDLKGKQISANLDDYFNPQKELRRVYTIYIRQTFQTAGAWEFFMDKGLKNGNTVENPEIILETENIISLPDIDENKLTCTEELNEIIGIVKNNSFLLDFVIKQLDYAYKTACNPEYEDTGIQEFVKDILGRLPGDG